MDQLSQTRIGELALQRGLITQAQLDECQALQEEFRQKGVKMRLGEFLVKKKFSELRTQDTSVSAMLIFEKLDGISSRKCEKSCGIL